MSRWLQILLGVAGAVVTLSAAGDSVGAILKKLGRLSARRQLRQLAAQVHIDHFRSVLGSPISDKAWLNNGEPTNWSERIWVDRRYYVQAICDGDNIVRLYSVTSRLKRFRPKVPFPNEGWYSAPPAAQVKARLHVTRFAEAGSPPTLIRVDLRANRMGYVEIYAWGNPSNYQSVALSVSEAGPSIGGGFPVDEVTGLVTPHAIVLPPEQVPDFRANEAPNTYTVSAPLESLEDYQALSSAFGANVNVVRVFTS